MRDKAIYALRRAELGKQYAGDGQGFYAADARLRQALGMALTDDHRQALAAERRQVHKPGNTLPF